MSRSVRRTAFRAIAAAVMTLAVTAGVGATAQAGTAVVPMGAQPAGVSATNSPEPPPSGAIPVQRPEDAVEAVHKAGPKTAAVLGGLYRSPNTGQVYTMLIDLENDERDDGGVRVYWRLRGDCHSPWKDTSRTDGEPDWRDLTEPWYKVVPYPQPCWGGPVNR